MEAQKVPRPDGLNGQFFQTQWENIKDELFNDVKNFFLSPNIWIQSWTEHILP